MAKEESYTLSIEQARGKFGQARVAVQAEAHTVQCGQQSEFVLLDLLTRDYLVVGNREFLPPSEDPYTVLIPLERFLDLARQIEQSQEGGAVEQP